MADGVGGPPSIAAFTIAYNEGPMLRRWVDHYEAHLGLGTVFVVDHGSTDGSTSDLGATPVLEIERRVPPGVRTDWVTHERVATANRLARELLVDHDVVIFADTDEFLVPDPRVIADLPTFLAHNTDPVVAAIGLNVLHDVTTEPPIRWDRMVLSQRRLAMFQPAMCKPLVRRSSTADWLPGFHGVTEPYRVTPELFLLHLKHVDDAAHRTRHRERFDLMSTTGEGVSSWWRFTQAEIDATMRDYLARPRIPLDEASLDVDRMVVRRPRGWRARAGNKPEHHLGPFVLPEAWNGAL